MNQISALIICGGKSTRMGRDKALLEVGGVSLVGRVASLARALADEVLVVAPDSARFAFLKLPVVADERPERGPLEALRVGLGAITHDWSFALACDLPNLTPQALAKLLQFRSGVDAVVPQSGGRLQPLCALYHKRILGHLEAALAGGEQALHAVLRGVQLVSPVPEELGVSDSFFDNLNTPEEFQAWLKRQGD